MGPEGCRTPRSATSNTQQDHKAMGGRLRIRHSSCKSKLAFCGCGRSQAHFHHTFGKRRPRFFPVVQSNYWWTREQPQWQAPNVDRSRRESDYLFQSAPSEHCNACSSSDHPRKRRDVSWAACLRLLSKTYLTFSVGASKNCHQLGWVFSFCPCKSFGKKTGVAERLVLKGRPWDSSHGKVI